jgi:hypothetical protein
MSKKALTLLFIMLVVAAGAGGVYLAEELYYKPMREQKQMIANLKTVVDRLTAVQRLAQVIVIDQDDKRTKFKFVEVNDKNERVGEPQVFDIEGDTAYFDTLVIEFKGNYDPHNDMPLKAEEIGRELTGHSIIFFRRVFSNQLKPDDGVAIDKPGQAPNAYRSPFPPTDFERKLWSEFWEIANDPKKAEAKGIIAASGQAPFMKLQKGNFYVLEKKLTGPPTIRTEKVPAVLQE